MSISIIWPYGNESQAYWGKPYQGFCNAATWMFHLYFSQEQRNMEAFRKLLPMKDELDTGRILRLFLTAAWGQGELHMEPLDEWADGVVNAAEVVEALQADISETVKA